MEKSYIEITASLFVGIAAGIYVFKEFLKMSPSPLPSAILPPIERSINDAGRNLQSFRAT